MCPNFKYISGNISKCAVLEELGIQYIPGPSRSGYPCDKCKSQMVSGKIPTKDTLTDAMNTILIANGQMEQPNIVEQAKSFAKAIIKWAFNGFANMPEPEYQKRVDCCKENKCGLYKDNTCLGCGCQIEDTAMMKGKARYPLEMCPADFPEWKNNPGTEFLYQPVPGKCGSCGKR